MSDPCRYIASVENVMIYISCEVDLFLWYLQWQWICLDSMFFKDSIWDILPLAPRQYPTHNVSFKIYYDSSRSNFINATTQYIINYMDSVAARSQSFGSAWQEWVAMELHSIIISDNTHISGLYRLGKSQESRSKSKVLPISAYYRS